MSEKITKSKLIELLQETNVTETKKHATEVVEAFLNIISDELTKGNQVDLHHIGLLKPAVRSARIGRNPSTGESLNIPESRTVSFRTSVVLKRKLND